LRALFVGKTPAPRSVEVGHFFQGRHGAAFWKRLKDYDLLTPTTAFEDDSMLAHGFGLTDIVKVPRSFGNEPSDSEYLAGADRILELIRRHKPRVVIFIYKKVLDRILELKFGLSLKTRYGFNARCAGHFRADVFAFPLPGVGACRHSEANSAMIELRRRLKRRRGIIHLGAQNS
jgi:mismatch-specific thymine-DNA glycosylase